MKSVDISAFPMLADIHSHILPALDDGSKDVSVSLAMLDKEKEAGVTDVVLTSHFYPEKEDPNAFLMRRESAVRTLKAELPLDSPRLYLGAEVAYYPGIGLSEQVPKLCIDGTRFMLLEMPYCPFSDMILRDVSNLAERQKIRPIIAHVERYLDFQKRDFFRTLTDSGALIQVNASFLLQPRNRHQIKKMITGNYLHFVGSDCHNTDTRAPNMGAMKEAFLKNYGEGAWNDLYEISKSLLADANKIN